MLAPAPPPQHAEAPVELVPVVVGRVTGRQPGGLGLGQLQQQVALAPPLGGDHRIEAHQQALAGEIVARDAGQSEALAQRGHLVGDRVGVGGVAGKGLHGDRAAIAIAQQAVHDLRSVGAVVAGVAVRSELAAGALEVPGGEVVEGEGAGLEMAGWRLASQSMAS